METYSIAEARDRLSSLIDAAERGEDIEITRYGHPVAVITSPERSRRRAPTVGGEAFDRARAELGDLRVEPGLDMAAIVREMRDDEG